jgi:hypothetical protein
MAFSLGQPRNRRDAMWDERYSAEEYAYGTEPNTFLTANFQHLPKGRF